MTWTTSRIVEGYGSDGVGEIEVYGTVISPGKDDPSTNSLDIKEAAQYINLLEAAMIRVIEAHIEVCGQLWPDEDLDNKFDASIDNMAEIISTDAWTLLRATSQGDNSNGATTEV